MADEYWVDIIHRRPKKRGDVLGADDYVIIPQHLGDRSFQAVGDRQFAAVGKKYRLAAEVETVGGPHHRSHSKRYWQQPLFYTVDYGDVPVTVSEDDYEIPDSVAGNYDVSQAWHHSGRNAIQEWVKAHRSQPSAQIKALIAQQIKLIKEGMARHEELTFIHHHLVLDWIIKFGRLPTGYPDNNKGENKGLVTLASTRLGQYQQQYADTHRGWLGDIVHAVNTVVDFAGKPIALVTEAAEHIPVIGDAIHAAVGLDPVKALGGIVSNVAHGERLDTAFLEAGKKELKAVKEVAPYVQTVVGFVPGVGTGVAAAIAAGTALAEGRTISDAVLEGLKGAVPGGQVGKAALGAALAITHGNNVASSVVDAVKEQLPPAARQAVDTAIAASHGKNVREAILQGIRANLPDSAKKALDIGVAVGTARNAQSAVTNALSNPTILNKLANLPVAPKIAAMMPRDSESQKGFKIAAGILKHRGVTPVALMAARSKLTPKQVTGFDHAIKSINNHFNNNRHTSLVRGGLVTRGNWKKVAANTKNAVAGRLVSGKSITHGHFVRV